MTTLAWVDGVQTRTRTIRSFQPGCRRGDLTRPRRVVRKQTRTLHQQRSPRNTWLQRQKLESDEVQFGGRKVVMCTCLSEQGKKHNLHSIEKLKNDNLGHLMMHHTRITFNLGGNKFHPCIVPTPLFIRPLVLRASWKAGKLRLWMKVGSGASS